MNSAAVRNNNNNARQERGKNRQVDIDVLLLLLLQSAGRGILYYYVGRIRECPVGSHYCLNNMKNKHVKQRVSTFNKYLHACPSFNVLCHILCRYLSTCVFIILFQTRQNRILLLYNCLCLFNYPTAAVDKENNNTSSEHHTRHYKL